MTFSFICQKGIQSIRYNLLSYKNTLTNYQDELKNHLPQTPNVNDDADADAEELLQHIVNSITKTLTLVLGRPPKMHKEWITLETVAKIEEKHTIASSFQTQYNTESPKTYVRNDAELINRNSSIKFIRTFLLPSFFNAIFQIDENSKTHLID